MNPVPKYYTPYNDDIYIAGTFNGWLPNNNAYKLTKTSYDKYTIALNLNAGSYEFKFTRGSWDTAETNLDGSSLPNRFMVVSANQKVQISIYNWEDMKGRHTAKGNLIMLDRNFPYPQFSRTKRIWVYLPPDYYTTSKSYGVIYMHDGQNLFDEYYAPFGEWGIDETMENMHQQSKETTIVVGIETKGVGIDPSGERYFYLNFLNLTISFLFGCVS